MQLFCMIKTLYKSTISIDVATTTTNFCRLKNLTVHSVIYVNVDILNIFYKEKYQRISWNFFIRKFSNTSISVMENIVVSIFFK